MGTRIFFLMPSPISFFLPAKPYLLAKATTERHYAETLFDQVASSLQKAFSIGENMKQSCFPASL